MRKEIHHHARRDSKLFTQQEDAGVLIKAFTTDRNEQFIDSSLFQEGPDFVPAKYAGKVQCPNLDALDRSAEPMCRFLIPHPSHMADGGNDVLREFGHN